MFESLFPQPRDILCQTIGDLPNQHRCNFHVMVQFEFLDYNINFWSIATMAIHKDEFPKTMMKQVQSVFAHDLREGIRF